MCTSSLLAVLGCKWFSYRERSDRRGSGVGDVVFLYSMCSLGAHIFNSVLGAVLILHKHKILHTWSSTQG